MKILSINTRDQGGGAESFCLSMHEKYLALGHEARLLVGYKTRRDDPTVFELDHRFDAPPGALMKKIETRLTPDPNSLGRKILRLVSHPPRIKAKLTGREDFEYPTLASWMEREAWVPDVIHLHNLHGDYFNFPELVALSKRWPIVWTLHDTWAFTGHCGFFVECDRWKKGCGACPDLWRYPPVYLDRTHGNWQLKRRILSEAPITYVFPSEWLRNHATETFLKGREFRVMPHGVDRSVFHERDKRALRKKYGIAEGKLVCLFVSQAGTKPHPYKDFETLRRCIEGFSERARRNLLLLSIGGEKARAVSSFHHHLGYILDRTHIAEYYALSDVILHAAKAENFPCVTLEAMACGTVPIMTRTGGIPEQIEHGVSGFVVEKGDFMTMREILERLAEDATPLASMRARNLELSKRYDLDDISKRYIALFKGAIHGAHS